MRDNLQWADAAGPNTGGDATYGNVDAAPWSAAMNQCTGSGPNDPPNTPTSPDPADLSMRVDISSGLTLTWTGGDPNVLDIVTYDIYTGPSADSLTLAAQDHNNATYDLSNPTAGTTYYWQVIARDNHGLEAGGPVWRFTADGDPPDLIVSGLTVDPAGNLQTGQTIAMNAQITNIGAGPVVEAFDVDFQIDGASIGTMHIDDIIPAGASLAVSRSWTYDGGDPSLQVLVDSLSTVCETIESNNQFIALLSEVADNQAPILAAQSPPNGSHHQQAPVISMTLSDAHSSIDDAAVIAGFSVLNESQQPVAGSVNEAYDTFTFTPSAAPLADGTYQISVTAVDIHGNQQVYQNSFTIDSQPPAKPTVTGQTVASGTIQTRPAANQADDLMVTLAGARDAGTSLWINGIQYLPADTDTWTTDLTLELGDNALEIWCVDQAGNQSPSEWVDILVELSGGLIFDYNAAGRLKGIQRVQ